MHVGASVVRRCAGRSGRRLGGVSASVWLLSSRVRRLVLVAVREPPLCLRVARSTGRPHIYAHIDRCVCRCVVRCVASCDRPWTPRVSCATAIRPRWPPPMPSRGRAVRRRAANDAADTSVSVSTHRCTHRSMCVSRCVVRCVATCDRPWRARVSCCTCLRIQGCCVVRMDVWGCAVGRLRI